MFASTSAAIPYLILLLLFAEGLAFVISRKQLPVNLDLRSRQKMILIKFAQLNLGILILFLVTIVLFLAPQFLPAMGNTFLALWTSILAGAAFINLRAIRARAEAGKPAVTLTPSDDFPKEALWWLGIGSFIILTSSGSTITIVTGLLYFGMAAMTYLNKKRGTVLAERGICKNSKFVPWSTVESYRWPMSQDENSTLTITYRGDKDSIDSLTITAPEWNRTHIESFFNQKLAYHEVIASAQVAQ